MGAMGESGDWQSTLGRETRKVLSKSRVGLADLEGLEACEGLLGLKIDLDERSAMDYSGRLMIAFISCCVRFLA